MIGMGRRQGCQMSELRVQFGRRLRQLRRQKDLTQEQLADAAGISVDMLSNIERGVNAPSFETLAKLARVLGVTVTGIAVEGLGRGARNTLETGRATTTPRVRGRS
jgi:transcriptional regulator with XRE-family HTH domain